MACVFDIRLKGGSALPQDKNCYGQWLLPGFFSLKCFVSMAWIFPWTLCIHLYWYFTDGHLWQPCWCYVAKCRRKKEMGKRTQACKCCPFILLMETLNFRSVPSKTGSTLEKSVLVLSFFWTIILCSLFQSTHTCKAHSAKIVPCDCLCPEQCQELWSSAKESEFHVWIWSESSEYSPGKCLFLLPVPLTHPDFFPSLPLRQTKAFVTSQMKKDVKIFCRGAKINHCHAVVSISKKVLKV